MRYVDVVLPLPLAGTFTYAVPPDREESVRIGMRIVVPFGSKKLYTGIIVLIHTHKPDMSGIKEAVCLLDDEPVIRRPQYKFWEWIASYYMSTVGEVYQAAVPAGLKLENETEVRINADFEPEYLLSEKEQFILDMLSDEKTVSVAEINKFTGMKDAMPVLKKLMDKGAVEVNESVAFRFRPKTTQFVKLGQEYLDEDRLKMLFDTLSRAPRQLDLLMRYIELSRCLQLKEVVEVSKKELLDREDISVAAFTAMKGKGIFETVTRETGRLDMEETAQEDGNLLNEHQNRAFQSIERSFAAKPVVLLHGVTSSGKTELYIHLIKKTIEEGRQVLYLVPEIALTTQLTSRLKKVFGNRLGVYHSRYSDNERVEIWNNVLRDKSYDVILGVRSSVFLPFRHLGLIIVDEEHEPSYKQYDPAPRYHARNAAIVLASMHGAKTLLGTATPSIETYHNALSGKYGLVEMTERFEGIRLPEIMVVDMKEAYRKKQFEGHFSDVLLEKIKTALSNKEQLILFQNRRGYAPYIECKACAYIPKCKHCDVSLTLHAAAGTLNCHYCGYTETVPKACPVCHTPSLISRGFGTEKIEDEIRHLFPDARVQRMDMDTTRNKRSYQKIISDFENDNTDILIGTQMVTKGLDFQKVSLVGVLNADNMLNFPDFRAHERAFQLMAQVSGRAGRKFKRGLVVVQTSAPEHPVISQVVAHDYRGMYDLQCEERALFRYPPFYRMIQLTLKHKDASLVSRASSDMAVILREIFGERVLGPVIPAVSRIQNMYIRQVILKVETDASHVRAKELLASVIGRILADSRYRYVRINIDVDPN